MSLTRDDVASKRHPALNLLFEHDPFGKPLPTPHHVRGRLFPDHARRGKGGADLATPKIALAGFELLARGLLSFD
jgi:hypothetical protein